MNRAIYLDYCATTPLCTPAREAYFNATKVLGNPSSNHHVFGRAAKELLEASRNAIAQALGLSYSKIVFTAGATEGNNLALLGFAAKHRRVSHRIIASQIEHKSILAAAERCSELFGSEFIVVPVDRAGSVDLAFLEQTLSQQPAPTFVAVMSVNNEIPAVQNTARINALCRQFGAHYHCDAVQSLARIGELPGECDTLTFSGHKIYGPPGIGVLVINTVDSLIPVLAGGRQELGFRPGTENVPAVAAMAAAVSYCRNSSTSMQELYGQQEQRFLAGLQQSGARFSVTVKPKSIGLISLWFDQVNAAALLADHPEIAISRGASCSSNLESSHVPFALGLDPVIAHNVLRISFGIPTSVEECFEAGLYLGLRALQRQ